MRRIIWIFICFFSLSIIASAQDGHDHSGHNHDHHGHDHSGHNHDHAGHDHAAHAGHGDHDGAHIETIGSCQIPHEDKNVFNPGKTAFHHISDQNVYSIGPLQLPLPVIAYNHGGGGVDIFSSGKFHADYHGIGSSAYNRFVLYEGAIRKIQDPSFPDGLVELGHHRIYVKQLPDDKGTLRDVVFVCYNNKEWRADNKSTLDGGLFGGGITSFTDLSPTKNVVSMFIVFLFLVWMLRKVAKAYETRKGQAPTGLQGLIEPIFIFIQDEVAKPFLGHKWQKFLPFLMSIFFFILGLNLFGQVPFFGGSNVTGNLSFTLVMALIAFIITNINGNSHYWGHIFNMPGLPAPMKLIITPVEIMGLFIKPLTLMLRLFGNMTAGHMVIVIFVGLIFIFGQNGTNPAAGWGMTIGSGLLTLFMMAIELLVAFIQAFVFTILTASYIGASTEDAHH